MNPALLILVLLSLIVLWFLLSFMFKPLGKIIYGIWNDTVEIINENDEETKRNKNEEKGEES